MATDYLEVNEKYVAKLDGHHDKYYEFTFDGNTEKVFALLQEKLPNSLGFIMDLGFTFNDEQGNVEATNCKWWISYWDNTSKCWKPKQIFSGSDERFDNGNFIVIQKYSWTIHFDCKKTIPLT